MARKKGKRLNSKTKVRKTKARDTKIRIRNKKRKTKSIAFRIILTSFKAFTYVLGVVFMAILFTGVTLTIQPKSSTTGTTGTSSMPGAQSESSFTGFAGFPDITPPIVYNPIPENNSYVAGGDKLVLVRADDENLNSSTVRIYIKSKESTTWDDYSMPCAVMNETTLVCQVFGVTLSLDIVGSDTVEQYYFCAKDYSGNTGCLGNNSYPLVFTVDINPPNIQFTSPQNNSYVHNNNTIRLNVLDPSSGVNDSTVKYSLDNSTWIGTSASAPSYTAVWNTTGFADNASVILYAKAADNIGNLRYGWDNVTVDNSAPFVNIISPIVNETLAGVVLLKVSVGDIHSGLDASSVYYDVEGYRRSMQCTKQSVGYECDEYYNTKLVSDGKRTITFSSSDKAGNSNSTQVQVVVDNKEISASITNPANSAYVKGNVYINVTVTNAEGKVTGAQMKITGTGYSTQKGMVCSADYKCYVAWNTSAVSDGSYTLVANVTSTAGKLINNSVSVTLDNTLPEIQIDPPTNGTVASGMLYPRMIITDNYGVNPSTVRFDISSYSDTMNCVQYVQGKKYVCGGNFNTTRLSNSQHTLLFYGTDLAGNFNSAAKTLIVNNTGGTTAPIQNTTNGTNETTTTTVVGATTTTTTVGPAAGSTTTTATSTTAPPIIINPILTPIVLAFGDVSKSLQEIFSPWPVKALAISMIIFLIVLAIFRNAQIIQFFKKGKIEKEEIEEGAQGKSVHRIWNEAKDEMKSEIMARVKMIV